MSRQTMMRCISCLSNNSPMTECIVCDLYTKISNIEEQLSDNSRWILFTDALPPNTDWYDVTFELDGKRHVLQCYIEIETLAKQIQLNIPIRLLTFKSEDSYNGEPIAWLQRSKSFKGEINNEREK